MRRFLLVTACLLMPTCYAHYDPAYMSSPKDKFTTRSSWMSQIPDGAQLSELALPGTHGSASYLGQPTDDAVHDFNSKFYLFPPFSYISSPIVSGFSANQVLNIDQQLQYGIRVFDVRILYIADEFRIMQGGRNLHIDFKEFLNEIVNFLTQNPSETVLFAVKIEKELGKNRKSASARLGDYLNAVARFYLKTKEPKIKLGETRGRFILLPRDSFFSKTGLSFYGTNIQVMDRNHLSSAWDMYKKWSDVKDHLELARKGDRNMFYVTYLTGYGGVYPYFVASGHTSRSSKAGRLATGLMTPIFKYRYPDFPRVGCVFGVCSIVFEGINILARDKIRGLNSDAVHQQRTVGIIMADFPGDSLIGTIIENNHVLLTK